MKRSPVVAINAIFTCAILSSHEILCQAPVPVHNSVQSRIDSLIKDYVTKDKFTGVILVAADGKPIYQNAFGLANREWDIPNTLATKFRIGSVTKPFVAVLTFKAIEKGMLRLEGKVSDYLSDYPKKQGSKITIHHLLSHTSGLIDIPDVPGLEWNKERLGHSEEEVLAYFKDQELKFDPGTDFHYSNFGYYLLSVILEKVTGISYGVLLQQQIFTPLKMRNTSVSHNRDILKDRASGYFKKNGEYFNAPFFDQSIVQGCGDIISNNQTIILLSNIHGIQTIEISDAIKRLLATH